MDINLINALKIQLEEDVSAFTEVPSDTNYREAVVTCLYVKAVAEIVALEQATQKAKA